MAGALWSPPIGGLASALCFPADSGLAVADFQRRQLNLVILLDVSGSMYAPFDTYYYDQFGDQQQVPASGRSVTQ